MIVLDVHVLSDPYAAGGLWFPYCRQMCDFLAELLPSLTDSF